jgi:hypothetical protein
MSESFPVDVGVGLLNRRKWAHLEHVTPNVVKPIVQPFEEEIDPVFLD